MQIKAKHYFFIKTAGFSDFGMSLKKFSIKFIRFQIKNVQNQLETVICNGIFVWSCKLTVENIVYFECGESLQIEYI